MPARPQDHKPALFSFEHDGKTYTFEKPLTKIRSFGWQRKHRGLPDEEKLYLIFEECAGDEAMAVLDEMDMVSPEFQALMERVGDELGGSLGESQPS